MATSQQNCVIGGKNASFPTDGHNIFGSNFYVAIEGNDTSFAPFATCCAPYKAQLAGPCLMWCQTNGDYAAMHKCWQQHDFSPQSEFGATGSTQKSNKNAIIGISVGSVAAVALLGGLGFWWWKRRAAAAAARVKERNVEGNLEPAGGGRVGDGLPTYEDVKYDAMLEKADLKSLTSEVNSLHKKK